MDVVDTLLEDVKLLRPRRFGDDRGWFAETFSARAFAAAGLPGHFVQDNQSMSHKGVLRGLHYQVCHAQGKLVRVVRGHIWDVAVDLRPDSAQFGRWAGFHLKSVADAGDVEMLWIPPGFAHGFLVLAEETEVLYKASDLYHPECERTVLWNDPQLGIEWPLSLLGEVPVSLSAKDANGTPLRAAELPERRTATLD